MVDIGTLVEAVERHAQEHYNEGGWDVVVECWGAKEIEGVLREAGATSVEDAIGAFEPMVSIWSERQADAKHSEF